MVIKTMQESGKNASRLIQTAVTMMAQEDWKDTVHEAKVMEHCFCSAVPVIMYWSSILAQTHVGTGEMLCDAPLREDRI